MRYRWLVLPLVLIVIVTGIITLGCSCIKSVQQKPVLSGAGIGYDWTSFEINHNVNPLCLAIGRGGTVFVGCEDSKVLRHMSQEKGWEAVRITKQNCNVNAMVVDMKGVIFAGTGCGIYRSKDNGSHWKLSGNGLTSIGTTVLCIDTKGSVYAGTNKGIFRSVDGGDHWTQSCPGVADDGWCSPQSIAIDRHGRFFLAYGDGMYIATTKSRELRKLDTGKAQKYMSDFTLDETGRLFVAFNTLDDIGSIKWINAAPLLMSDDDGKTWQSCKLETDNVFYKLTSNDKGNVSCLSLATGPDRKVAVNTIVGLYLSFDGGEHWWPVDAPTNPLKNELFAQSLILKFDSIGNLYILKYYGHSLYCGVPTQR